MGQLSLFFEAELPEEACQKVKRLSKQTEADAQLARYLKEEELGAIRDAVEDVWRTVRGRRNRVEEAERLK